MRTSFARKIGAEFPIFAFSHCRDVVAAVTNAGGIGVLGAVAHSPEGLETDLAWIDDTKSVNDKEFNRTDELGNYKLTKLEKWGSSARKEDRESCGVAAALE